MTIWADTYNGVALNPLTPGPYEAPNHLQSKFCFHVFQIYLSVLKRPRYRFQFDSLTISLTCTQQNIDLNDIVQYKSQPIHFLNLKCLVNDEEFRFGFRPAPETVTVTMMTGRFFYSSKKYSPANKIRKSAVLQVNRAFLQAIENLLLD